MVICSQVENVFNHMLNVHAVYHVRQMHIHTFEPSVPEPSFVKVEIAIGKFKRYTFPHIDQIPAELFKDGGETLCSEIHKLK
jgi:hypothetical protein